MSGAFSFFQGTFSGIVSGGGIEDIALNIDAVSESVKFYFGKLLRLSRVGRIKEEYAGISPVSDSKESVCATGGLRLEGTVQIEMFRQDGLRLSKSVTVRSGFAE